MNAPLPPPSAPPAPASPRVLAAVDRCSPGAAPGFILSAGPESIALIPGQSWIQADRFKWVTRGLLEPPQSFHVHADGSVDLNGEHFSTSDEVAAGALTRLLNLRHAGPAPAPPHAAPRRETAAHASRGVVYHVRLDPYGHLLIRASRGHEQTETGMRGLAHLATEGWTRPFKSLHVDPLQRYVEIHGRRFDPTPAGAAALETFLTEECTPPVSDSGPASIEVRENAASSTGFDIAFHVFRAGARTEIHGHLTQEKLDALQDPEHCDLLQPDVVLRLAPPFLYFRRRRPDGGETPIPEMGDVKYRATTAAQLQHLLNHPALRRGGGLPPGTPPAPPHADAPEAGSTGASSPAPPAPTQPADAPAFSTPPRASDPHPTPPVPTPSGAAPHRPPPLPGPAPQGNPDDARLLPPPFDEPRDPHLVQDAVFRALAAAAGAPVQDLRLSLDRVFHDRRFEVVDLGGHDIESVLQLRHPTFHGFYLVHLKANRLDLVFAHHGLHFEWGTDRCLVQPAASAESIEYSRPALLGAGQRRSGEWVFVVTPAFREWARRFEPACQEAEIAILDPYEFAAEGHRVRRLWPPPA